MAKSRIILLLDLDCFYAQCEMIRLDIPKDKPVCLLQWNSALAINYPARKLYKFKRGVSFEEIQSVSKGECIALHLPVISLGSSANNYTPTDWNSKRGHDDIASNGKITSCDDTQESATAHANENDRSSSSTSTSTSSSSSSSSQYIETLYNQEYNKPQHIKNELFEKEKNIMKKPHQGKASLERYRLASTFIFETIKASLEYQQQFYRVSDNDVDDKGLISNSVGGSGSEWFILEKASVDELYLDVTKICYDFDIKHVWKDVKHTQDNNHLNQSSTSSSIEEMSQNETVIYASKKLPPRNKTHHNQRHEEDPDIQAIHRGCIIARGIRKAVYDKLGFTLSAGISTSKLVAKLGASYGKPNGQAVVLPDAIHHLMENTPIRKARNLGGKIGKEVQKLLPPNEDKMSSIAKYLSLDDLNKAIGYQSAKMVFDACRGIDDEPVKETKGALSKSITAFKSFGPTNISNLGKWITLLTTDVFARVKADSMRNNRFPKICTIQYYYRRDTGMFLYLMKIHKNDIVRLLKS